MNYATIKYNDIANGEGIRTSLFVSGCTHKCKGCFNAEAWDFSYGKPFTEEVENEILSSRESGYIDGLSLLGGEPFEPSNQLALYPFLQKVKQKFPNKDIWLFTGFLFDVDLVKGGQRFTEYTDELLSLIDIIVDGRFVEELHDITLQFRGSSN